MTLASVAEQAPFDSYVVERLRKNMSSHDTALNIKPLNATAQISFYFWERKPKNVKVMPFYNTAGMYGAIFNASFIFFPVNTDFNKPYAYSECACAKSIPLSQVKGQPV